MSSISRDFTKGSIPKQLFSFMIPFMLSNALQVLYATVDMIIVGQFVGSNGLAAVSQGSQIVNFGVMFFMGFANGGQVLIAQVLGAGKKKELNKVIGTLFTMFAIIAIAFTVLLSVPREFILHLVNMPEEGFDMAMDYVLICGGGIFLTAGYNGVSAILRGMGDSKRPFYFITIASVINLVLDLLFTGALGWGVAGAAAATIIGQAVAFIIAISYLFKHRESFGFNFKLESFKIDARYAKTIIKQGIPMAIQNAIINVSMVIISAMVNELGIVAAATFGVGIKIDDICLRIGMGIQYAGAPMVGQNYGAKDYDRVKKVVYWCWIYAVIYTMLFIFVYMTFGDQIFGLFTTDPAVIALSGEFRLAIFWEFICLAVMRGTGSLIQGVGNANLGLVLGILDGLVLRVGLGWLFGMYFQMGFFGFILGYGLAPLGFSVPGLIYFISGRWKNRKTLVEQSN